MRSGRATAFVRNLVQFSNSVIQTTKETIALQSNNRGDVCIVQSLLPVTESIRLGNSWISTFIAPLNVNFVGVAPVIATDNVIGLINPLSNDKVFVVDTVNISVGGQGPTGIQLCMLATVEIRRIIGSLGNRVSSLSGTGNYKGKGQVVIVNAGNGIYVGIGGRIQGNSSQEPNRGISYDRAVSSNLASSFLSIEANLQGRFVVPPGNVFSFIGASNQVGVSIQVMSIIWHEVTLKA